MAFTTDGEPAEMLAGVFAKAWRSGMPNVNVMLIIKISSQLARQAKEVLPQCASVRCQLHTAQRSLERAMQSDPRCEELLQVLINKFSGSKPGQRGSLARALKNSGPLLASFQQSATRLVTCGFMLLNTQVSAEQPRSETRCTCYQLWLTVFPGFLTRCSGSTQ